jgi:peptidoglycan hydrolase-like protein with peptidoglycan-binding domain
VVVLTGGDRYETASLVATEVRGKLGEVNGVVVTPGDSFADALSAAPLAAAKGWPILLTPASGPLPDATRAVLRDLAPEGALVVGTHVQLEVEGAEVTYVAGADRYDTCAKVAEYAVSQGLSYAGIGMATGEKFPDALAAGPYLGKNGGILLLTNATGVPSVTAQALLAHADEVQSITFLGLEAAVTAQVKLLLSSDDLPEGFAFSRLSMGSQGPEVLWLEQRLANLTYRPGAIDGIFDKKTYQAVMAFQKWERLSRDGVVGSQVWQRLLAASPPQAARGGSGTWIEVDKSRQVLLYVTEGTVVRTLAVSTGNATVGIVTPTATFTVYAKSGKWDGPRYKPLYLRGILAIHGYPSVPAYPASHGCIRVPLWDQDELFPMVAVGTKVYVY